VAVCYLPRSWYTRPAKGRDTMALCSDPTGLCHQGNKEKDCPLQGRKQAKGKQKAGEPGGAALSEGPLPVPCTCSHLIQAQPMGVAFHGPATP
jgi:hypothetical protein